MQPVLPWDVHGKGARARDKNISRKESLMPSDGCLCARNVNRNVHQLTLCLPYNTRLQGCLVLHLHTPHRQATGPSCCRQPHINVQCVAYVWDSHCCKMTPEPSQVRGAHCADQHVKPHCCCCNQQTRCACAHTGALTPSSCRHATLQQTSQLWGHKRPQAHSQLVQ